MQEFAYLRKQYWGNHFWARGYMAVNLGNITDEMIQQYIDEQEGETINDDLFLIDYTSIYNISAYSRELFSYSG
ncbi:transposase IS200-family protein [Rickettsia akari str. Hartford]|uniref:Transposase IS200-family protein n=2 Tax=Rickettsia akari (strain Hartford) TaxID=293614 RepID=A8GMC8_RICAH|nr:transposase IS200-family protein [Rickettsia akari str. Hartford]